MSESESLLGMFTSIYKRTKVYNDTSYSDVTEATRVTPLCIASNDLRNYEHTAAVLQTALNVVTSYYMQALPMVADIGGVNIKKILGRLSTNSGRRVKKKWLRGTEGYVPPAYGFANMTYSLEASDTQTQLDAALVVLSTAKTNAQRAMLTKQIRTLTMKLQKEAVSDSVPTVKKYKQTTAKVMKELDASNLAVGKMIEVTLKTQNGDVTIPVTLQLQTSFVTPAIATAMMSSKTIDSGIKERYYKMRSGTLSGKDFALAGDLVKKRKMLMIQDDAGLLEEIQKRRRTGKWNALSSGESQLGADNNVLVVSSDVIKTVEREHRGRITSQRIRNRIFDDMGIMVMVIVDKEEEYVTFYYKGMKLPTDLPIKSLKKVADKGGPDIGDILKSMMTNQTPTF